MNVREELQLALREASEADDAKRVCTIRLIQAAIRDRDAAHCAGNGEKITLSEIADLLRTMIKQREEQLKTGRVVTDAHGGACVQREIDTLREFMPPVMDEPTMRSACAQVMSEIGAAGLRDVGRTIAALKKRYPGQMDMGRASCMVRGMLR